MLAWLIKKGNLHHAGHPGEEGRTRSITHPKNFPRFCKKKPAVEIRFSSGNTQCGGGGVVVVVGGVVVMVLVVCISSVQEQSSHSQHSRGEKWSGLNLWSAAEDKIQASESVSYLSSWKVWAHYLPDNEHYKLSSLRNVKYNGVVVNTSFIW